jgi:hypothetical protein
MIEERSITMVGISMHNETDYALTEAMTQEILEPTASGASGYYVVLRRVHEPLLASIFWLALGCVLGWPDEGCVVHTHAQEGEGERALQKPRSGIAGK